MVKRYDWVDIDDDPGMMEFADGEWVRYEDYEALMAEFRSACRYLAKSFTFGTGIKCVFVEDFDKETD